jgi:hypothetical protein
MDSTIKKLIVGITIEAIVSLAIGIVFLYLKDYFIGTMFCVCVVIEIILVKKRIDELKKDGGDE